MSVQITIQGNVIDFPTSGSSPNWAPAVVDFAQAVETALESAIGEYDIAPQSLDILNNQASAQNLAGIAFPSTAVRSFALNYTIYRSTATPTSKAEVGTLTAVFNDLQNDWVVQRGFSGDDSGVTFTIDNTSNAGQLKYTSSNISGASYSGKITLSAKALLKGET
jgi:hypothetical protein